MIRTLRRTRPIVLCVALALALAPRVAAAGVLDAPDASGTFDFTGWGVLYVFTGAVSDDTPNDEVATAVTCLNVGKGAVGWGVQLFNEAGALASEGIDTSLAPQNHETISSQTNEHFLGDLTMTPQTINGTFSGRVLVSDAGKGKLLCEAAVTDTMSDAQLIHRLGLIPVRKEPKVKVAK